jgi:hypothetical protein
MTKPIPDKAEVALEYPDKFYIGTFEGSSRFDAHLDEAGICLTLERRGDADVRKSVHIHFHYALFSAILQDLAATISGLRAIDADHREPLRAAAEALCRALAADVRTDSVAACAIVADNDLTNLTPQEEVLLLHVME